MSKKATPFSNKLIAWYLQNKRDLPWRNTLDPYHIWLSEIILQQTRVLQGLPYYLKFVKAYPTINDLANAPEDEILKLWQGLGYYSRARNLHFTAQMISKDLNGIFPNNYKDLLKLKGVGDYTASAIASISFNKPEAVVDGNVYRVLSRYFGISTPINSSRGQKEFKNLAQELIDREQPGNYNQAIMEFGAQFCIPQNPDCQMCIYNNTCAAFQQNRVAELPVKTKAKPIKRRYFNYLVFNLQNDHTLLKQRTQKGIWHNLYEFPLIETFMEIDISDLVDMDQFKEISQNAPVENVYLFNETPIIHKLSHQHLITRFWIVEIAVYIDKSIPISEVGNYAVPVLIENFVSDFFEGY